MSRVTKESGSGALTHMTMQAYASKFNDSPTCSTFLQHHKQKCSFWHSRELRHSFWFQTRTAPANSADRLTTAAWRLLLPDLRRELPRLMEDDVCITSAYACTDTDKCSLRRNVLWKMSCRQKHWLPYNSSIHFYFRSWYFKGVLEACVWE